MSDISAPDLILSIEESQAGNRWYFERQRLNHFPSFTLLARDGTIIAAEGALDTQFGNAYGLRIELENYPYARPSVRPKGWTVHPRVKHQFTDGSICVMRADQWRKCYTVALMVAKAAVWLGKYEIWKRKGIWPGLEQRH